MSALFESGFFVRQPAWHGMGTVLDTPPKTWKTARKHAGIEWDPMAAPAFGYEGVDADGKPVYDPDLAVAGNYVRLEDKKRVIRNDNGATLGVPSSTYEVIDHGEIGAIVEALNGDKNVAYETTVSLDGGKAIAVVVRLDEPVTLPGDNSPTLPFMALTTRHDGTGSLRAQSTSIRVVCMNTFSAAEYEADRNGTVFVFSHTKNWREHVEGAKLALQGLRTDFTEYVEFASHLAKIKVTEQQTASFLAEFIPAPMSSVEVSDRVARNIEEARLTVKAILESPTCEALRGSALGLVQAGGEYLDWYRGYRTSSTLFGRQMLRPEQRKVEAVKIVRELVGV